MSDNNNHQTAKRIVHTIDLESGEALYVAYFPVAGVITINGNSVTPAEGDQGMDEQSIFLRRIDKKLFTIDTMSLSKLFI